MKIQSIEATSQYDLSADGLTAIDFSNEAQIRELLLGHRVAKVGDDHLLLDDGTLLKIVPNQGGCACSAGDYELTELNECDNIITRVECATETTDEYGEDHIYTVFVYAENRKINLLSVEGSDGNGYYGTGYEILVRPS